MNATMDISKITLHRGGHSSPKDGHCLLEVVAMFAGEPFSDNPPCVDPVLRAFGMGWNDGMRSDEEREQLKQYIARLPGTNKGPALAEKRSWMAMDWLIRVHTAAWFSLSSGLAHHAEMLKSLPSITCTAELVAAQPKLDAARKDANAAGDAAWDAARDAARAAARAAAWDAARAAAWDAAGDAAWAAAWDAAWDASRAAAWAAARDAAWAAARDAAALAPTVKTLQVSAHELFSKMIDAE